MNFIHSSFNLRDESYYNKKNNNDYLKIVLFSCLIVTLLFITSSSSLKKLLFYKNINLKSYFIPNTYRLAFVFGIQDQKLLNYSP